MSFAGLVILAIASAFAVSCTPSGPVTSVSVPSRPGVVKTVASLRAERRAYDGAPPVMAHQNFGSSCTNCHNDRGMAVEGVGFAPALPHGDTLGMSDASRCQQCHVPKTTDGLFRGSTFRGQAQALRMGERAHFAAPPVMPHPVFMRENCTACHTGPGAREEIRTSHPERPRCSQCHVAQTLATVFTR